MIIITDKTLVIPVGIAPNYAGAGNADVKLQSKSVTITENGSKTLFPDSNYTGFSQVNITTNVANNPVLEDKSVEIIENGDYSFIPGPTYDGIGNFRLKVNVETYDPIQVQPVKTAYPSFENDVTVVPSEGYEAMSSVIVKKAEPNLQDKTVAKASTSEVVLRADAGYQGLGTVTVAPIKTKTVSADPSTNVQEFSANTEVNEYITNVTVNPVNTTSINVDPSTNVQTVNATENTYISTVTVNPVGTKTVTLDSSINAQTINANVEGNEYITSVTVNPVSTKTVNLDPSTNSQEVNANVEGNEYITSVTVNPVSTKTVNLDPSTNVQTVNANVEGNEYITSVTVNPVGTKTVTVDSSTNSQTFNANVEGNEYITSVTVNPVSTKSLSITPRIVEQTFTAEQQLYKTVNVSAIKHTEKTYDASTNTQTYDYAENNDVFIKNLTINPVTSSIDPNIVPENILKGVTILGVNGTLEKGSSNLQSIIANGPAFSSKITVNPVYIEDKQDIYTSSDEISNVAGTSGYIPFFMKNKRINESPYSETVYNSLGTLDDRGIVAYAVNGVIYENPTSFNIPYTKKTSGDEDVTIDVYIDFTKANARAEIIENTFLSEKGSTTINSSFFDEKYRYLPPISNMNDSETGNDNFWFQPVETYVRESVNALSALFISYTNGYRISGNFTLLLGKDGLKRIPDMISQQSPILYKNVTVYGNINNYTIFVKMFKNTQTFDFYGNVNDVNIAIPESSRYGLANQNFFGIVNTLEGYFDYYKGNVLDKVTDSSILDICENNTSNPIRNFNRKIETKAAFFPNSLKYLYDNTVTPGYQPTKNYDANFYVFFSKTPPTMPTDKETGKSQSPLFSESYESGKLTIYIPTGADYSSIISTTKPPTIIEFTPVSSTSEINGPGIFGLTDNRGYHSLIEIKPSTQAEQDLQTVATEINTL